MHLICKCSGFGNARLLPCMQLPHILVPQSSRQAPLGQVQIREIYVALLTIHLHLDLLGQCHPILRKCGVAFGAMKGESLRHTVAYFVLDADACAAAEDSMPTAHVGKLLELRCSTQAVADRDQIRSLLIGRHLGQSSPVHVLNLRTLTRSRALSRHLQLHEPFPT